MKSAVKIWRESKERYKNLDKRGKVVSWTKIIEPPVGWQGQYYVAIIELLDKKVPIHSGSSHLARNSRDDKLALKSLASLPKTVGQLIESKKIKTGDVVVGVLRKLGEAESNEVIEYGVKWKKI